MTVMFKASSLSSGDLPPGWTASEFDRYRDYMGGNWLPSADIGHNNPPGNGDPGPDLSHRIGFHIPEWVPRDQVREFEHILQEQGPYPDRMAALDHAACRVRATASVSHRGFRLYDGILELSKGEHRCCLLDLDKLGFISGILDRANVSKVLDEIEEPGLVKTLRFTEGHLRTLGSRKVLIAPIITTEDRRHATAGRVLADAEAAKKAVLEKRAGAERARYNRRTQSVSGGQSNHQVDAPVVDVTTRFPSGQVENQKAASGGRGDFSSGCGNHLLSHIDKPQEEGGHPNGEASSLQPSPPNGKPSELGWLPTLNAEAAARKAFAVSQVTVSKTGKVAIGPEFRAALREDFTDSQIDRGLEKAARYMEGSPEKRMANVRTACGWAKEDDRKQFAAGKLQSARRTFAR